MERDIYMNRINCEVELKAMLVDAAAGRRKADLVLKNASYVNVFSSGISRGDIAVFQGRIVGVGTYEGEREVDVSGKLVLPGFIDAHIHLESAMVTPQEFMRAVLPHGTTAVIADPHEIANVMGADGIEYMLQAASGVLDVFFMLPSCVPATPLDESGATLDYRSIDAFYEHPRVLGLAEMMNFPGVIQGDTRTLQKIVAAQAHHKKIDGHAPGLAGNDLNAYIAAGVYSDHECYTLADALAKLERGQYIMIREGTAAHNLEALMPLLTEKYASRCMFCCDDKHPSDLLEKGHIDYIVREAVRRGADPILTVKVASLHAARYFQLNNRGAVAPGFLADLMVIDNFHDFNVEEVYKEGFCVARNGKMATYSVSIGGHTTYGFADSAPEINDCLSDMAYNTFHLPSVTPQDFIERRPLGIIGLVPGELITTDQGYSDRIDTEWDILKIAVVERHKNTRLIGLGYLQGYGLQNGAIATSVAHDSHNIIVVGTNEEDMAIAVNHIKEMRGGITVVRQGDILGEVPLPIAGLMSDESLETVNRQLEGAKEAAFRLGVQKGIDPFMTLSFLSLPVIPKLRLTTRGLIDVENQQFI